MVILIFQTMFLSLFENIYCFIQNNNVLKYISLQNIKI